MALVHDWLVSQRGGENVLLELARLYPQAPIYTLVHQRGSVHPELESHRIITSFIQDLPGAPRRFRPYLPLFPRAVEAWDFADFDLVISTSHCVVKGVVTHEHQLHISYIHTPMRYLWDQMPQYLGFLPAPRLTLPMVRWLTSPLRRWDVESAGRPDALVANSRYVAERIERVWGREARVLHPPVDADYFAAGESGTRRGYLVVSALVPYKQVEIAVRLATRRSLDLTVIGEGPERARLEALGGPTVRFLGGVSREDLRRAYGAARGLLFCGVEDFGIVPLEAQAAGCPVVALREGGAVETVSEQAAKRTGVFFGEPTEAALEVALDELEKAWIANEFIAETMRVHALSFGPSVFASGFAGLVAESLAVHRR